MKKINLIERLWKTDSHEKQSPQRFGRYAVMLFLLLTLGVGQMWANSYWYRGGKNSWAAQAMTVSDDGKFEYCLGTYNGHHEFKICVNSSDYTGALGCNYTSSGFCRTDITDMNSSSDNWGKGSNGNIDIYNNNNNVYYILVYYPNTAVNSSNDPKICASTYLPDAGYETDGNTMTYYSNLNAKDQTTSALDRKDGSTTALGTVTSLYLKGFNSKMWQHGEGNIYGEDAQHYYFKVHRTAVSAGSTGFTDVSDATSYAAGTWNWSGGGDWSSNYRKPTYNVTCNHNLLSGLGSGNYTMSYYFVQEGSRNFRLPSDAGDLNTLTWTIAVPSMATHTCTSDGTGAGSSESPFSVAVGEDLTITVSGTKSSADANSSLYVSFDGGDTYTSANTYVVNDITSSKLYLDIKAKYYNSADDLSGTVYDFGRIYYQGTLTPSLAISSFTQNASTVTAANSGSTVTINASRQNAGSATITYAYSTDNSNWTTIASTTSTTQTWTLPAVTSTTTYYVKASMNYNSTDYDDTESITVYGKKTIKVKDTNNWGANFKVHRWNGAITGSTYPGETTNVSSAGGQWKQVVLYSSNTDFLLCNGSSTDVADANRTANKTYAGMTDGGCYEIQSGSGASLTLTSTPNCPAKPSVSSSAATSVLNTSATINGSISNNGNDNITSYGFYWSADADDDTAAELEAKGTQVEKGTSNYTGSITYGLTSLTANTTYHYVVYATNGQGTQWSSVQSFTTPYKVTITKPTGCSTITPGTGTQYVKVGDNITATKATGYTFSSWTTSNVTLGTPSTAAGVTTSAITAISADNGTIQPVYTEDTHTVTLAKSGNGHVEINSATVTSVSGVGIATASGTITAVPDLGYYFTGWTGSDINNGVTIASGSTSTASITIRATADSKTITANFAPIWALVGTMNSWNAATNTLGNFTTVSTKDYGYVDVVLNANTEYSFKMKNVQTSAFYKPTSSNTQITYVNKATAQGMNNTADGTPNQTIMTAGKGTYRFTWNATDHSIKVTYPDSYTITFGSDGHASSVTATVEDATAITSGQYAAAGKDVTFSQTANTGYTFKGWYTSADGNTAVTGMGTSDHVLDDIAADATVYAQYSKPDTIMLNPDPETLNAFAAQHSGKDTLALAPSFNCDPTGNWHISYMVGYSENHTLLEPQPTIIYGTGANVGKDSIKMPYNANTYEIISILYTGTTQGSGTEIMRDTSKYIVEDMYSVKARRIVDGIDITEPAAWSGYPSSRKTPVSAPLELNGYVLDYWELGVGIDTVSGEGRRDASYETKQIYAHNNGTVRLHYKPKPNTVYFMDGFDMYWYSTKMKMYDYGTSIGYWNDGYGADSHDSKVGDTVKMASHGTPEVMMMAIGSSSTNFAITNKRMDNYGHFHGASEGNEWARVIYRTDFNGATSMFVPVSKEPRPVTGSDFLVLNTTETGAAHYYRGFWVKYSPNRDSTGYYLRVYDKVDQATAKHIQTLPLRLTQTGEGGTWELTAKMDLEANKTYGFKITKATSASTKTWYSYNGTLTAADHEGKVLDGTTNNIGLTTTSAGDYTFHVFCKAVTPSNPITASDVQGQLAVTVDYAAVSGDYRVIYSDATQTEVIASPSIHPREDGQDTVSFFIRKNAASRVMKIQKFTSSWADFGDPIDLSAEPFSIAKDSVYVIYLQQNEDGTSISATGCGFYDGDFYIRTDCVDEHKWDYKQSLDNHRMTPSDFGLTDKQPIKFSHYYVHWIDEGGNVKFVVANKYAPCVSDTLIMDTYANAAGGCLPSDGDAGTNIGASVRFMYNKGTNAVNRAYLAGAQGGAYDPNYLKLHTDGSKMGTTAATPAVINNITFTDLKNFVYQAEIKAKPGLTATLTAQYNGNTQYFKGSPSEEEEILGGTGDAWQQILLTYDFKVNRLICAWQPDGDSINGNVPINADIMVIRTGQNDAQQIIFKNNDSKLSDVKYIYSVMQFNYDDMVGHMYTWGYTAYQYCMYYISFPYDVLVNDIMAPGTMGNAWRLQRYNGAERAKGWFAGDGVSTFWEDVQSGDTLHAYEGYSLLLNRRLFNDGSSSVWLNKGAGSKLYMYFPSKDATVGVVANKTVNVTVPSHECTVDRIFEQDLGKPSSEQRNHKIVDSHWNMIGTPLFEDQTASTITAGPTIGGETLNYIYAWNPAGNTLGIKNTLTTGFEFKTMYGYMAQYAGTITFIGAAVNKVVAANRNVEKKNYTMNLELTNGDDFIGRTYVELRENAVDSFLLNEDVYMVKNGVNADLYTLAGAYEAGANVLSVDNHIVPVGVDVKAAGTYTFSMPDNFDGEVILVDNYTQTRTNLMIEDYEIALPTGTITDRFYIEININKTPTAIDGVDGGSLKDGKAHKFIMNDQMYILKDGEMFDARGNRVK